MPTKRPHNWGRPIARALRGYGLKHDRIRRALLKREPNCRECAKIGVERRATHADHIIPRCIGGSDDESNYQPLCTTHAQSKTGREGAMIRNAKRQSRLRAKEQQT